MQTKEKTNIRDMRKRGRKIKKEREEARRHLLQRNASDS